MVTPQHFVGHFCRRRHVVFSPSPKGEYLLPVEASFVCSLLVCLYIAEEISEVCGSLRRTLCQTSQLPPSSMPTGQRRRTHSQLKPWLDGHRSGVEKHCDSLRLPRTWALSCPSTVCRGKRFVDRSSENLERTAQQLQSFRWICWVQLDGASWRCRSRQTLSSCLSLHPA